MTVKLSDNIKSLALGLLLLSVISSSLSGQSKSVSGVINKYGRVTTIGTDYVIVKDDGYNAGQFASFEKDDTVLLFQMKGVRTYVTEGGSYGLPEGYYGLPGQHEFLIIESITPAGKQITFKNDIQHSFNISGNLQIIKVPTYNEATVTSNLTCEPWDSLKKTGGVLALITGRALILNDSIDVSGKGFLGGAIATGLGLCAETNKMYKYAYPVTAGIDSAGFKGESPVSRGYLASSNYPPVYPLFAKGKGANLSGGGGGDGKYSGGGGGGNYGAGGTGGREASGCGITYPGGLGGKEIKSITYLANTLKGMFLGGGGGASTTQSGTPTPGGNGGGIVILISDTIKGNSNYILADGAGAHGASGNSGAGGGGGGGTVAVYVQSYTNLTLASRGGKGGNNAGTFGEGGGGGGGLITTNTPSNSSGINKYVTGGAVGSRSGASTGTPGGLGENLTTWVPLLNGFLFNSIRSSVTNNQVDSICSDVIPKPITGTTPVGGSGSYSYKWLKSLSESGPWTEINLATQKDYTPGSTESATFWIRRRVQDNSTFLVDTSKALKIIVQPAITGNLVGKDTTICINQNPLNLVSLNSGPSNGNGKYQYQWLQNDNNLNWTTSPPASGTANLASYDPPALSATIYYQRKVTSGRCVSYSPTVTIDVLTAITGNKINRPDSIICEGSAFNILSASLPTGATGTYTYLWQDSITSGTWQPAAGTNSAPTHSPSVIPFATTEHRYFRRVAISGPDDVCKNNSAPILLTMWQAIENNIISADQAICSGETPGQLSGLTPTQGDHVNYTFQWQDSSQADTWTTRSTAPTPYSPSSLVDTTWYRRIVNSSKCVSTSNKIVVNVHDPITNNFIEADTTICNGSNPKKLRGKQPGGGNLIYGYQWYSSTDNFVSSNDAVTVTGTLISYDPPALSATMSYRREVISGMCKTLSNSIRVTVLPSITANNITPDKPEVCFNTIPGTITGSPLTGGAGGTPTWIWQDSTSGNAWVNIGSSTQNFVSSSALTKQTWFRRIIKSGPVDCCIDTSAIVPIDTLKLPAAIITSVSDTTICSGKEVRLRVHLTGAKNWNLVYNENSSPVSVSNISSSNYTISRIPVVGSSMVTFNYSLASLTDNNGCVAVPAGLSGSRKADVYRTPVANAGPDAAVCGPKYNLGAVPTDGTGTWTFPAAVLSGNTSLHNATIRIDSSFTTASVSHKMYWQEINWTCPSKDSVIITFYNRIDTISAGNDTAIMSFDNAIKLNAYPVQPYETGKWSLVSGSGDFENDALNSTWVTGTSVGTNIYRWSVTNGECILNDNVTFEISNPVIPELISPNNDTYNDELVISGLDYDSQTIELNILNGAGSLVFSTSNKDSSNGWMNWDGRNSNGAELPEGTYYFILKVSSGKVPGHVSRMSGFIILKRQ
jgi:gliding motility-associated-like protein